MDDDLAALLRDLSPDQIADLVADLSLPEAEALLGELGRMDTAVSGSPTPLGIAPMLFDQFVERDHLSHLSDRIASAVRDVEGGTSRNMIIQLPPRSGKTTLSTLITPSWLLARHPGWPHALVSHDGTLASSWGRQIRRWVESSALGPTVMIAPDAGAAGSWETTAGGRMFSLSIRESFIGRGAKVLIIDDPHKDFVDAHSPTMRRNVWDWWLSVAQTRLEPPSLVLVVQTRWHEDDLVGRLLSRDYEGDPDDWEVITIPAIADDLADPLGRVLGEPLISPLIDETPAEALARWEKTRRSVGEYVWSAMFQQSPAPARGSIFDTEWWRFWTTDPELVTEDGRVILINPAVDLARARWLDSWDLTFKGTDKSDYVVGQRWARLGPDRFLIDQLRGRWSFVEQEKRIEGWAEPSSPYGHLVHERIIEDAASGAGIVDRLSPKISGLKAVRPRGSKEIRADVITPEIESGHVRVPHPQQAPWVNDFLAEVREFPHGKNDDQVDAMSQALTALRDAAPGRVTVPGSATTRVPRDLARLARSDLAKHRSR